MPKVAKNPLVSVVVTTKNESKNIERCLKSIRCQSYKYVESIVVDNNSDDKTKTLAKKYTNLVYNKGPERSAQRNYGMITVAKGKFVMFVDADMILSSTLIEQAVSYMQENKDIALFVPEIVLGKGYWSRVRRFERSFYDATPIDGARFFVKKDFDKIKGFDESLYACEDWDLTKRLQKIGKVGFLISSNQNSDNKWPLNNFIKDRGVDPVKCGAVIFHNEADFDLKKYLNKKGYYSENFDVYFKKWGKNDPDLKKQFGMKYRFFVVFFEHGKWLKLISNPILTFGMYYLKFLVGIRFLRAGKK